MQKRIVFDEHLRTLGRRLNELGAKGKSLEEKGRSLGLSGKVMFDLELIEKLPRRMKEETHDPTVDEMQKFTDASERVRWALKAL